MARGTTKLEARLRAEHIWSLRLQGNSVTKISKLEGIRPGNVYYWLEKFERLINYEFKRQTTGKVVRQFFAQSIHRQKEIWKLYNETQDDSVRAQCLKLLGQEDDRTIEFGQSIGLVEKVAEKRELSGPDGQPLLLVAPAGPVETEGPELIGHHGNGNGS